MKSPDIITKKDLVKKIADRLNRNKNDTSTIVNEVVNETIAVMWDALTEGASVRLDGFGHFAPVVRKSRKANNISTGEMFVMPETRTARFKPSRRLVSTMTSSMAKE